ncbi:hypothetical protein GQ53DRAFT_763183 [Thozetella sp. PMI_491]|nr:hypothetical protein GQ53DRAFT_763183 [Thozetella sp. PMI_491]
MAQPANCSVGKQIKGDIRAQLKPAAARYFHALYNQWINRAGTSTHTVHALEQALRMCDITINLANQRIYRNRVDGPLRSGQTPDFVSVRALWCLAFGRIQESLRLRLRVARAEWMLSNNLNFNLPGNADVYNPLGPPNFLPERNDAMQNLGDILENPVVVSDNDKDMD